MENTSPQPRDYGIINSLTEVSESKVAENLSRSRFLKSILNVIFS
jgi:hypothetical protein